MTDLEMIKKCAELMELDLIADPPEAAERLGYWVKDGHGKYDPLVYDDQAMALVKRFKLRIDVGEFGGRWLVTDASPYNVIADDLNLNRAIVKCVMVKKR
jgi:hypothetical protein